MNKSSSILRAVILLVSMLVLPTSVAFHMQGPIPTPAQQIPFDTVGTGVQPLFSWSNVPKHYFRLCIWRPDVYPNAQCTNGENGITVNVDGTDFEIAAWMPDKDLPVSWYGKTIRWMVRACYTDVHCSFNSAEREFIPLAPPAGLTVIPNPEGVKREPYYNWNNVAGADSYQFSLCCTSDGHVLNYLTTAKPGGRPFRLSSKTYDGLYDQTSSAQCATGSLPYTWWVSACHNGGCGEDSAKQAACMGQDFSLPSWTYFIGGFVMLFLLAGWWWLRRKSE